MNFTKKDFFKLVDVSGCRDITIQTRVRVLLMAKGMTQNKLAEEIGITKGTLSKIVTGQWGASSQIKIRMANILGVDSLVVFGADEYWKEFGDNVTYPKKEEGE